jgi:hypothetical protein
MPWPSVSQPPPTPQAEQRTFDSGLEDSPGQGQGAGEESEGGEEFHV